MEWSIMILVREDLFLWDGEVGIRQIIIENIIFTDIFPFWDRFG